MKTCHSKYSFALSAKNSKVYFNDEDVFPIKTYTKFCFVCYGGLLLALYNYCCG